MPEAVLHDITAAAGISAHPAIAAAWRCQDQERTKFERQHGNKVCPACRAPLALLSILRSVLAKLYAK